MSTSIGTGGVVRGTVVEQEAEMGQHALVIVVGEMVAVLVVEYLTESVAGGNIFNRMVNIHKIGTSHFAFSRGKKWTFLRCGYTILVIEKT